MDQTSPENESTSAMALSEDLRRVLHRLFRQLRREGQDFGISPLHALLLVAIREKPGIGVGELARLERLRGPTISGHVKTMEAMGLIERSAPDPNDRRRIGLIATQAGADMIERIKRSRTDWLVRKLTNLPPDSRAAIRNAINALQEIVE